MPRTALTLIALLALAGAHVTAPRQARAQAGSETAHPSDASGKDSWADYKEDLLARFPTIAPRVGQLAVDHTGIDMDGNPVRLADLWGRKPVVLEFGTCT